MSSASQIKSPEKTLELHQKIPQGLENLMLQRLRASVGLQKPYLQVLTNVLLYQSWSVKEMIEHVIGAEIKFSGSILEEVSLKPFGNGSSDFTKDRIGNLNQYFLWILQCVLFLALLSVRVFVLNA